MSTKEEQEKLITMAQQTLRVLMISLMLGDEHEIIHESYKKKLDILQSEGLTDQMIMEKKMEPLLKILLRCRQYYESKYEIVRILVKAR